jgi:DNA-directed RNA polymerase specialized sigma subunit
MMSASLRLASHDQVVRALLTFTDWWQPVTASVYQVGSARRNSSHSDGIPAGLLSTLDLRTELCLRMSQLPDRDRRLLFLWYVKQLAVEDIAKDLGISRRQCFRRRANAIREVVKMGETDQAA